ncbi:MAG: hypothetical protein WCO29_22700 [Nostocales cyanobacterium ELA583]|jgi:hypothetical protein
MAQFPTSSDYPHSDNSKGYVSGERKDHQLSANTQFWHNLKYVISASSGFKRWQLECNTKLQSLRLDQQVQMYLRETLETLAY